MHLALNLNIEIKKIRSDSSKDYYELSNFYITFGVKKGSSDEKVKSVALHFIRSALKKFGSESF